MRYILDLYALFGTYWYVAVPELAYILFFGIRFLGIWVVVPAAVYLVLLAVWPAPVLAAVGALIVVHAAVMIVRSIIADKMYKDKTAECEEGASGGAPDQNGGKNGASDLVPKLSGQDKHIQDELDELKKSQNEHNGA